MENSGTTQTKRSEEQWTERQGEHLDLLRGQLIPYCKEFRLKALSTLLAETQAMPDDATEIALDDGEQPSSDTSPGTQIVLDWLGALSMKAKLACVLMANWHVADHGTDDLVNDLLGKWEGEILAAIQQGDGFDSQDDVVIAGTILETGVVEQST